MTMNPTHEHRNLPRYGIREDEMTRPGVVLFDWNGDEPTVTVQLKAQLTKAQQADAEELESYENLFRPRWHGIGRTAGATALGVVLGLCAAIGLFVLLESEPGGGPSAKAVDVAQR